MWEVVASVFAILSCYVSAFIYREKSDPVSVCDHLDCISWRFWRWVATACLLLSWFSLLFTSSIDNSIAITILLFGGVSSCILGRSFYVFR